MHFSTHTINDLSKSEKKNIINFLISCYSNEPDYKNIVYSNHDLDTCILLTNDDFEIIGHSSILKRSILFNKTSILLGGVGNVAIRNDYRGLGYGKDIMLETSTFLKNNNFDIGMLFCEQSLEKFYSRNGWVGKSSGEVMYTSKKEERILEKTLLLQTNIARKTFDELLHNNINVCGNRW